MWSGGERGERLSESERGGGYDTILTHGRGFVSECHLPLPPPGVISLKGRARKAQRKKSHFLKKNKKK